MGAPSFTNFLCIINLETNKPLFSFPPRQNIQAHKIPDRWLRRHYLSGPLNNVFKVLQIAPWASGRVDSAAYKKKSFLTCWCQASHTGSWRTSGVFFILIVATWCGIQLSSNHRMVTVKRFIFYGRLFLMLELDSTFFCFVLTSPFDSPLLNREVDRCYAISQQEIVSSKRLAGRLHSSSHVSKQTILHLVNKYTNLYLQMKRERKREWEMFGRASWPSPLAM